MLLLFLKHQLKVVNFLGELFLLAHSELLLDLTNRPFFILFPHFFPQLLHSLLHAVLLPFYDSAHWIETVVVKQGNEQALSDVCENFLVINWNLVARVDRGRGVVNGLALLH